MVKTAWFQALMRVFDVRIVAKICHFEQHNLRQLARFLKMLYHNILHQF